MNYFWLEVNAKVNCKEIVPLIKGVSAKYKTATGNDDKYISAIVANAYISWISGNCVAFFSTNERWAIYNKKIRERKYKFSVIKFRNELKWLQSEQLIDVLKGYKVQSGRSMASRFFPTENLAEHFDVAWEQYIETNSAVSIVRDDNDNIIDVEKSAEVVEDEEFMKRYNSKLAHTNFTYTGDIDNYYWDKASKKTVKVSHKGNIRFVPQLTAIYKNDFMHGGRLYSRSIYGMKSYQSMSKKERDSIRINGKSTVEVDFSCLHLNLMYASVGKQMRGDAYSWCKERKLAKIVTLITLNCDTKYSAACAIAKWAKENDYAITTSDASQLISFMLYYHREIREVFFKEHGLALQLQYADSRIMRNVLKRLRKRMIVGLPVHDSVIVKKTCKDATIAIMKDVYKEFTGFDINVK